MATKNPVFTCVEYVWLDAEQNPRSKAKVMHGKAGVTLKDLSDWNYDGSSTGQAPGEDSEVIIKPQALFNDPFRGAHHAIVICDCYTPKGEAIPTNTRYPAEQIFNKGLQFEPWFGIEQEYVMFKDGTPLGWPKAAARSTAANPAWQMGYPGPQGPYYCSAGADVAFGREIVEEHMFACLKAGINISGINAEVMPGQWEFQVGPCVGIAAGDQMVMARYILNRICEKYGVVISLEPKPVPGDWNGSGCHTNFSTKQMREEDDALNKYIIPAITKLGEHHAEHIAAYGSGNEKRLTGHHETASMHSFSWGVASRKCSVRVGNETAQKKKGYFEDRRPASNMDPYVVTSLVFKNSVL